MGWIPEIEWDDWQPQRETLVVFAVLTGGVLVLWWDTVNSQTVCGAILSDCSRYLDMLPEYQLWGLPLLGMMIAFLLAGGLVRLWEEMQEQPADEQQTDPEDTQVDRKTSTSTEQEEEEPDHPAEPPTPATDDQMDEDSD